jgi:hypothetical protein
MTVKLTTRRLGMARVLPSSWRPGLAELDVGVAGGGAKKFRICPSRSCAPVAGAGVLLALLPALLPSQLTSITLVNTTPQEKPLHRGVTADVESSSARAFASDCAAAGVRRPV